MCQFHSFLFDNYTGDIYDAIGVTSHAEIATQHRIDDDAYWPAWYNVVKRQVYFEKEFKYLSLAEGMTYSDPPYVSYCTDVDILSKRHNHEPWNQQALDRLERYLKQRFGTPERLVDFVAPQWRIAQARAAALLTPRARPGEIADLVLQVSKWKYKIAPPNVHLYLYGLNTAQNDKMHTMVTTGRAFWINIHRKGGANWQEKVPVCADSITIDRQASYTELVIRAWPAEFEEWKTLFLKKENRIPAWQQDPEKMLAL